MQGLPCELLGAIVAQLDNWADIAALYGTCRAIAASKASYPRRGPVVLVREGVLLRWRGTATSGRKTDSYMGSYLEERVIYEVTYHVGVRARVENDGLGTVWRKMSMRTYDYLKGGYAQSPISYGQIPSELMNELFKTEEMVCMHTSWTGYFAEALVFENAKVGQQVTKEVSFYLHYKPQ